MSTRLWQKRGEGKGAAHAVGVEEGSEAGDVALLEQHSDSGDEFVLRGAQLRRGLRERPLAHGEAALQVYGEGANNTKVDADGFALQAGLGLDRLRKVPGWSLSPTYVRIEQEATLSMFSYSDLGRGGTNQEGVILQAQYRPVRNVTLTARDHIVSPIRGVTPDTPVNRLKIDITFAF